MSFSLAYLHFSKPFSYLCKCLGGVLPEVLALIKGIDIGLHSPALQPLQPNLNVFNDSKFAHICVSIVGATYGGCLYLLG